MATPIPYDERTALVVVDVQNDFADPVGALSVREGERIIPVVNDQIEQAQAAGSMIVFTQDWHPPETPHFERHGGKWPVHCVRETWGSELHPDLKVDGEKILKGVEEEDGYSGFTVQHPGTGETSSTGLQAMLRAAGVEKVVVVGLATDYCVKETALDALRLGFSATVLREAVCAVDLEPGDGDRALEALAEAGVTLV